MLVNGWPLLLWVIQKRPSRSPPPITDVEHSIRPHVFRHVFHQNNAFILVLSDQIQILVKDAYALLFLVTLSWHAMHNRISIFGKKNICKRESWQITHICPFNLSLNWRNFMYKYRFNDGCIFVPPQNWKSGFLRFLLCVNQQFQCCFDLFDIYPSTFIWLTKCRHAAS